MIRVTSVTTPAFTTLHTFFKHGKATKSQFLTLYGLRTVYRHHPETTNKKESAIEYETTCIKRKWKGKRHFNSNKSCIPYTKYLWLTDPSGRPKNPRIWIHNTESTHFFLTFFCCCFRCDGLHLHSGGLPGRGRLAGLLWVQVSVFNPDLSGPGITEGLVWSGSDQKYFFSFLAYCIFQSYPQSNELTGGTTELVQDFRLQGEFT